MYSVPSRWALWITSSFSPCPKVDFGCLSLLTLLVSFYQHFYLISRKGKKVVAYFIFHSMKAEFLFTFQEGPFNLVFKEFEDQFFL